MRILWIRRQYLKRARCWACWTRSRWSPRCRLSWRASWRMIALAPLAACMRLMIPAGLDQQADVEYALLLGKGAGKPRKLSESQQRLLSLLEAARPAARPAD